MVDVEEIFRIDLDELVKVSYEGDIELFEKYHVGNFTFEEAVEKTLFQIDEMSKELDLSHYKVLVDRLPVGYFSTFNQGLYSFSVAMNYRTKEVLSGLWEKIISVMEDQFGCVLYKNNTRAINWLLKCGMIKSEDNVDEGSVLLLKL